VNVFLVLSSTPLFELLNALERVSGVIVSIDTEATISERHHHGVGRFLLLGQKFDRIFKNAEVQQLANVEVKFLRVGVFLSTNLLGWLFLLFWLLLSVGWLVISLGLHYNCFDIQIKIKQ
jgi:hypothetical protein